MREIYGFEPVCASDARVLVLGTMPSVKSLEEGFYYAHPQNAFWRVMAETLGCGVPRTVDDKKRMLIAGRVALWDVARACVREGSLDSNIRNVEPNDINALISRCPGLRKVLFNGKKARELYDRFFSLPPSVAGTTLPSTSPAYTLCYGKKLDAWRKAVTLEEYNERH